MNCFETQCNIEYVVTCFCALCCWSIMYVCIAVGDYPSEVNSVDPSPNSTPKKPDQLLSYINGYVCVTEFTQSLWCEQKVVFHLLMPEDVEVQTPAMARGNELHLERGDYRLSLIKFNKT